MTSPNTPPRRILGYRCSRCGLEWPAPDIEVEGLWHTACPNRRRPGIAPAMTPIFKETPK